MLTELTALLDHQGLDESREGYVEAIVDANLLGKRTAATRRLTAQRLSELYALSPKITLFRALRQLWSVDVASRPLLAALCANARDPLLRASAEYILAAKRDQQVEKPSLVEFLATQFEHRFNASILDKIARNILSSWTQSGHLSGRQKKIRIQAEATPASVCYALLLAHLSGLNGHALFSSLWLRICDATVDRLMALAHEASRRGLMTFRSAGDVIECRFPSLLTRDEEEARGKD